MLEDPDFEQNYYSRTATDIHKSEHNSVRLRKSLAYHDISFYEKN